MLNRRLPFSQLFVATLLGVAAGLYIYKPLFQQYIYDQRQLKTNINVTDVVEEENK